MGAKPPALAPVPYCYECRSIDIMNELDWQPALGRDIQYLIGVLPKEITSIISEYVSIPGFEEMLHAESWFIRTCLNRISSLADAAIDQQFVWSRDPLKADGGTSNRVSHELSVDQFMTVFRGLIFHQFVRCNDIIRFAVVHSMRRLTESIAISVHQYGVRIVLRLTRSKPFFAADMYGDPATFELCLIPISSVPPATTTVAGRPLCLTFMHWCTLAEGSALLNSALSGDQ